MNANRWLVILVAVLGMTACKVEPSPDAPPGDAATPAPATPPQPQPQPQDGTPPAADIPGAAVTFDIASAPLSRVALGPFPFIRLPEGYAVARESTLAHARLPLWFNNTTHWVEGRIFQARLEAAPGRTMSRYELKKNFEAVVTQMGGVAVAEGEIPRAAQKSWGQDVLSALRDGLQVGYQPLATIWMVRRDEGDIWIQLAGDGQRIGYIVAQEAGFTPTASMLQASELKQRIDETGKVDLQVNFATDRTAILPESLPQIEQVAQLLQDDPALQLAINGHTDNTGDAGHNQALSEGRAASVVAALVARGIEASRLQAAGFGATQPVASNDSEDGKARNRRVELVKR